MMENKNDGLIAATLRSMGAIGKENAITRAAVAAALGYDKPKTQGARRVSKILETERKTEAICGCGNGIFLPDAGEKGREEMRQYIRMVEAMARGAFRSLKGTKLHLKGIAGQTKLEEFEGGEETTG